jgi:D-cysteine desulfhydrase
VRARTSRPPATHPDAQRARPAEPLLLKGCPSPVQRIDSLALPHGQLWVKNDGGLNPTYGGNKVRKLEPILREALARGARRLVTVGAAGSHHVLATCLFGRELGIPTAAVLTTQPWTDHAEQTLRASLGSGLQAHPAPSLAAVPWQLARLLRAGDRLVTVGGSSVAGVLGYVEAAAELAEQIRAGELPEPDVIVAALGSGGTVAGLLTGVLREGLRSRVLGVSVAARGVAARALVLGLARAAAQRLRSGADLMRLSATLLVDTRQLGRGYGHPTNSGAIATELARAAGLSLDPTYTAKAFAGALALLGAQTQPGLSAPGAEISKITEFVELGRPLRVLYWHTLSCAPLKPLMKRAPGPRELPPGLRALLLTG